MPETYNPIACTFFRFKEVLADQPGVVFEDIWPSAELETLIPVENRAYAWVRLRRARLRVPELQLPTRLAYTLAAVVLIASAAVAMCVQHLLGLVIIVPLAIAAYTLSRPWAVVYPLGLETVGELVIHMTPFAEHRHSGHRWTHDEISTKVRLIFAENCNVPLDKVRPVTPIIELDKC